MSVAQNPDWTDDDMPMALAKKRKLGDNRATNVYLRHASYQESQSLNSAAAPESTDQTLESPKQQLGKRDRVETGESRFVRAPSPHGDISNPSSSLSSSQLPPSSLPPSQDLVGVPSANCETKEQSTLTHVKEASQHEEPTMKEMQTQLREMQERLTAAENRFKSLESARDEDTDNMDWVLSLMMELLNSDQAMGKRVEKLEEGLTSLDEEHKKNRKSMKADRMVLAKSMDWIEKTNSWLTERGVHFKLTTAPRLDELLEEIEGYEEETEDESAD
ncbi:hypothetical protein FSARC_3769 [Fusarium sarcochroum]|uniref:Uncharacterized protein n=1 Tax=Fusarium sarcochroum TaxID=1208366 RepID=A0A8H4XBH1_9HYPO|nr:hypothetical protein FSARC_3769 [Fusarium sarcochroum]